MNEATYYRVSVDEKHKAFADDIEDAAVIFNESCEKCRKWQTVYIDRYVGGVAVETVTSCRGLRN